MSKNSLDKLFKETNTIIVDGALATELEFLGCDLNDSLWSAKILLEQPHLIKQVHYSYFDAGADVGISASYQATIDGFVKKGYSIEQAKEAIKQSMTLLNEARNEWWNNVGQKTNRSFPLLAGSVGPYGAFLADGSEYNGNYNVSDERLKQFHRSRIQLLWSNGAEILAAETIPSLNEAKIIAELVSEINGECWISFSCKSEELISNGELIEDCAAELDSIESVKAIGINCTPPQYVESLIKAIKRKTSKPIVVYPNSGLEYDSINKQWIGENTCVSYHSYASVWQKAGASMIGGCCKTTPEMIKEVAKILKDN